MFLACFTFHFFCLEFVVPLEDEAQFFFCFFLFFALGTVWPLSLQLRLQIYLSDYCLQLHAP